MDKSNFNDYIDEYINTNPMLDDNQIIIEIQKSELSTSSVVKSGDIFKSDENILVLIHPFVANNRLMQHSHDYFELLYVSRGKCTQTINNETRDLTVGDICLLSPNDRHSISTSSADDLLFNILIKPSLFQDSFLCLIAENDLMSRFFLTSLFTINEKNAYLYFPSNANTQSSILVESIIREFFKKDICYKKSMECYLALLFTELLRTHKELIDRENYEIMGNNQLSDILSYINQHKNDATLSSVAKAFHYHPTYLSALIKKHTNKSFSEIILEAKLQEACYYLKNTELPVEEIAQLVGYYDRSYFHRVFKKQYGLTPNDYRLK